MRTAAGGTVLAYQNHMLASTTNGVAQNTALVEVHSAANMVAVNVVFFAVGKGI